jgi:hypothetical protein
MQCLCFVVGAADSRQTSNTATGKSTLAQPLLKTKRRCGYRDNVAVCLASRQRLCIWRQANLACMTVAVTSCGKIPLPFIACAASCGITVALENRTDRALFPGNRD